MTDRLFHALIYLSLVPAAFTIWNDIKTLVSLWNPHELNEAPDVVNEDEEATELMGKMKQMKDD